MVFLSLSCRTCKFWFVNPFKTTPGNHRDIYGTSATRNTYFTRCRTNRRVDYVLTKSKFRGTREFKNCSMATRLPDSGSNVGSISNFPRVVPKQITSIQISRVR
jgi:hypothetical protein